MDVWSALCCMPHSCLVHSMALEVEVQMIMKLLEIEPWPMYAIGLRCWAISPIQSQREAYGPGWCCLTQNDWNRGKKKSLVRITSWIDSSHTPASCRYSILTLLFELWNPLQIFLMVIFILYYYYLYIIIIYEDIVSM